ncbi:RsiG family protein [Saccharothrix sp. ST-888]|uniref:RsiG family protein n=1 Tax=Saccharothrix sp. ST-888 TaxID=1427391 RepID=UPI000A62126D|nr:ABC transporter substrate-binding protein [Saccharothrix sp. ST-888]
MDASSTAHDQSYGFAEPGAAQADPVAVVQEPPARSDLAGLDLDELRMLRRDAQEQEADLSYLRRLLQGRLDILQAELERRRVHPGAAAGAPAGVENGGGSTEAGAEPVALLDRLAAILADTPSVVRRPARHVTLGPPRGEQYQREADALIGDVQLADLAAHPTADLLAAVERLAEHEREVSGRRQILQRTADGCSAEMTRRYREGEARVEDLLAGG